MDSRAEEGDGDVGVAALPAQHARTARRTRGRGSAGRRPDTRTSPAAARHRRAPSAALVFGVGADDLAHQAVADHVALVQVAEGDALDAGKDPLDLDQAGVLARAAGRSGSCRR